MTIYTLNRADYTYRDSRTNLDAVERKWTLWSADGAERKAVTSFRPARPWVGQPDVDMTARATNALYQLGVRATSWHQIDDDTWQADTAPARGMWEVTAYAEVGSGVVWRRTSTGWTSRRGVCDDAGLRRQGPMVPLAVTGLAALIAEVEICRARATLLVGPADCLEGDCDEAVEAHGEGHDPRVCSHLTYEVVDASDVLALRRVRAALDDLTDESLADYDTETLGAGFAYAVQEIRDAIARDDNN